MTDAPVGDIHLELSFDLSIAEADRVVVSSIGRVRRKKTNTSAKAIFIIYAFTFLTFFALPSCAAAVSDPVLSGYTKRTWDVRDGLPEQTVQAFAQTPDGYLWIGTTGGLVRFDGARFVVFDHENTPAIIENSVFCLMSSRDGSLWFGTEGGGLVQYREGVFRTFFTSEGLTNGFIRKLYEDTHGTIWIGTDNGLFRFQGGHIVRVDGTTNIPAIAVHAIMEDRQGGLWVGGSKLLLIHGDAAREYQLEGLASQNRIKSILETHDGNIYVGTVSGLQKMVGPGIFKKVKEVNGTVRVLQETSDNVFWAGTIGQGIVAFHGNASSVISAPGLLPSNTVLAIFEDKEKNVWIGMQAGLLRLSKTPISLVLLPDSTDSDFGTVYQDPKGTVWVASTHLYKIHNGAAVPYAFPGLANVKVRNLLRALDGTLWLGTDGNGIFRLSDHDMVRFTTKQGLVNNFCRALLQSRDGSIWIATDEGVSHWTNKGFTNYQVKDGLSYFSTRALLEDRQGDIWVGTDRGISHLHMGVFQNDPATEGLRHEKIWTIHEDPDGGLWFGTRNDGLYRYKLEKLAHITTAQGLASNSIYQILEDRKGDFWASGPNGISLLNRRELDEVADGVQTHLSLELYGISDEVENTELYGGTQPAGCIGQHEDVWFPSNKGPLHIAHEPDSMSVLPRMIIEQILADGRAISNSRKIELAPGNSRLEISYAPILLGSQEDIRFRYKLEGFDQNWNEVGSRRVAYYTNLPAGQYTLRVAAFATNNPQRIAEVSLSISQKPHFYRTPWFLACMTILTALLVWGLYRFRLRQLRSRFQAVLQERTRLAREMHDTLIQGCASVSALLEAVTSMEHSDGDLRHDLLSYARTQVRVTIDEARQAVWNLRRGDVSTSDIGDALQKMADQISKESGVLVECRIDGTRFALNQSINHELIMVAREAVYNATLHARPARVLLSVVFGKDELTLAVEDDGRGFDPSALPPDEHHYGIVGMQERVKRIGGGFQLQSEAGKGSRVVVYVPRTTSVVQVIAPEA
jgi:ligand-binding sensor domain-containing protein/signal transduction histidine kinase